MVEKIANEKISLTAKEVKNLINKENFFQM